MSHSVWMNYKIVLDLTDEQKEIFDHICHTFRFCYNWALNYCNTAYREGRNHPTFVKLASIFTEYRNDPKHKWLLDYNVQTCRYAIKNVLDGYQKFFAGQVRHPKYKKKRTADKKFKIEGSRMTFRKNGEYVHIPGFGTRNCDLIHCPGSIIPYGPNIVYHNVYLRYDGIQYWLTLSVEMIIPFDMTEFTLENEPLGIDLGVRTAATLSNGMTFESPNRQRVKILDNRRRKVQSSIYRDRQKRMAIAKRTKTKYEDVPKTKNELKREDRYRQTIRDITNLYNTTYHKISKQIANLKAKFIVVEGFDARDLLCKEKHRNANDMVHAKLSTLREFISYKCKLNGTRVITADWNYPSSQICSRCGSRHKIGPSKTYTCPECGLVIDRDLNAALNLRDFGIDYVARNGLPEYSPSIR